MSSRRKYVTQTEVEQFANINIINSSEGDDQMSMAEEIIDAYVGYQEKFIDQEFHGEASSGSTTKIYDTGPSTVLNFIDDYFAGCEVEIIGGTGAGQRTIITTSSKSENSITVSPAFSIAPDATSVFRIYQLGKFPRAKDVHVKRDGSSYYKTIPEAVKRATAAQIEYIVQQGPAFFAGDGLNMQSETIGNYSYSRSSGNGGTPESTVLLVAPKARALLRGIVNRTGRIVAC